MLIFVLNCLVGLTQGRVSEFWFCRFMGRVASRVSCFENARSRLWSTAKRTRLVAYLLQCIWGNGVAGWSHGLQIAFFFISFGFASRWALLLTLYDNA